MATYYVDDGGGKAVSAATNANPCQVTVTGHGFSTNDKVVFHNVGGMTQINFTNGSAGYTVTVVDADNFTIGVDSTAYGTYTSGGTAHNGKSWGAAYTSVSALDDVFSFASGDIAYIGHDHVCQYAHAATRTLAGPSSGLPIVFVSATTGSNPPTYQASTANQIDTSEGSYQLTLTGRFALYGVTMAAGGTIAVNGGYLFECKLKPPANGSVSLGSTSGYVELNSCVIDLTSDGTTNRSSAAILTSSSCVINFSELSFVNAGYRTGTVVSSDGEINFHGCDFSGFTNATLCELFNGVDGAVSLLTNCKVAATWGLITNFAGLVKKKITAVNISSGDAPTSLLLSEYSGDIVSSTEIHRSSGAQVEGVATSWLVTTQSVASADIPFNSPYIYGYISSTGSKTFDLYITNDTADFTDAEVWLEIDYKGTASSGKWTRATDAVADRTTTGSNQTDDTTSTWNGSGPSYTYKQKLSVTATVNTVGMFRARVCVGVESITSTRKFYIDPLVTVS